ncbi:MAG: hypothetical protein WA052_00370 [Microgenomates group bacterium]
MTKEILFSEEEEIDNGEVEIESPSREEEELARIKRILDEFGIETDPAEVLGGRV